MTTPLRLGFVGAGWIGFDRMRAVLDAEAAKVVACCEPDEACRSRVVEAAPAVSFEADYPSLLQRDLDGVVIATPSALHAEQSLAALEAGKAVFCQKPIARTAGEVAAIVEAARAADRRLGCDLSYREVRAFQAIYSRLHEGAIGRPYALELVFHNAYGPDKPWYYERALAGGGCVMDLGIHLADAALWLLDFPALQAVERRLFCRGKPLAAQGIEDFAEVQLSFAGGAVARLTCSWNVSAGRDAVIEARVYGTEGGLEVHNLGGSFYDFVAKLHRGTQSEILVEPPDPWGGRTLVSWCRELSRSKSFDPSAERLVATSRLLDAIYAGEAA